MLSFLVVFSVFNHVHGAPTCVINTDEDLLCTTGCNKNCDEYLREPDGARRTDRSCAAGQTVQDCQSMKFVLGQINQCLDDNEWLNVLWEEATPDEKTTGILTSTTVIPNLFKKWRGRCEIHKPSLTDLGSVECENYQQRDPAAFSVPAASGGTRNYLHLVGDNFGKYCEPAPRSPRSAKTDYRDKIFALFSDKAATSRTAAGAAGLRARTRAVGAAGAAGLRVRAAPPKSSERRPKPRAPPKSREGRTHVRSEARGEALSAMAAVSHKPPPPFKPKKAHEEYVNDLWSQVNQMEEDDLRYERALDKLRRATQLREMHKKRLRRYYN